MHLPIPVLRHGMLLGLTLLSLVVLADGMARIELARAVAASACNAPFVPGDVD
jgi:hypothetical protein